jgi:hypothetical protein
VTTELFLVLNCSHRNFWAPRCPLGDDFTQNIEQYPFSFRSDIGTASSVVGMVIGLRAARQWQILLCSPKFSRRIWRPPSVLFNEHRKLFLCGQSGWGVKLTAHFYVMPRSVFTSLYAFMSYEITKLLFVKLKTDLSLYTPRRHILVFGTRWRGLISFRSCQFVCLFLAPQPPTGPGPPHSRGF